MARRIGTALAATAALVVIALGIVSSTSANAGPQSRTEQRTLAFLRAIERQDLAAVDEMIDRNATLTVPLSFSGAQEPAGRFLGRQQVLGYLQGVFANMATIRFVDVRVSVTDRGQTAFVQANGDFATADGRPYRNVYVFRFDWKGDRIVRAEEYGNPVTFCKTFGGPGC